MSRNVTVVTPMTTGIAATSRRRAYFQIMRFQLALGFHPDVPHVRAETSAVDPVGVQVELVYSFVYAVDPVWIGEYAGRQLIGNKVLQLRVHLLALGLVDFRHSVVQQLVHLRVLVEAAVVPADGRGARVPEAGLIGIRIEREPDEHDSKVALGRKVVAELAKVGHGPDLSVNADFLPLLLHDLKVLDPEGVVSVGDHVDSELSAVLLADSARACLPAGAVKELARLLDVVCVLRTDALAVGPRDWRQYGVGDARLTEIDCVDESLAVESIDQSLTDRLVVEDLTARLGRIQLKDELVKPEGGEAAHVEIRLRFRLLIGRGIEAAGVDLSGLELLQDRHSIGNLLVHPAVEVHRPAEVIVVADQHQLVTLVPLLELEFAVADRR